jgi:sensor histidine kinase YesM
MKLIAIVIVNIIFLTPLVLSRVSGQVHVDSLISVLASQPHDTIKIDTYLSLAHHHEDDTVVLLEYLNNAIELALKIEDMDRIGWTYLEFARFYRLKGRMKKQEEVLEKINSYLPRYEDQTIVASYYRSSGLMEFYQGDYGAATNHFIKAISFFESAGNMEGVAKCYNNIGSVYWELDQLDNALENFTKALEIAENGHGVEIIGSYLGNIGLVYRAKKEYDKALEYYTRSLELNQRYGQKLDAAINMQNIAVLYINQENYQKALQYMLSSNKISREIDDRIGVLYSSHGLASVYGHLGQYDRSIQELEKALIFANELNNREEIKNIYESLSNYYEKTGQFDVALENRKYYETWKDSLLNENHLNQVKELDIKYETALKDQKISELALQNEIQEKETLRQATLKKAFIGGFILITLLAGLIIYTTRQRLKNQKLLAEKDKEIKEVNFKQQLSELEMKALRAQINPHFLYNCMNSINRMILEKENENASQYLAKFSKLVRLILENAEKPAISLQSELDMLEAYINLESLRFKGKINYTISVDGSVDPDTTYLPSMVLQPFVENAIWHGLMNKKNGVSGMIKISVKEENEFLNCSIEDNGIGREAARELREKSVLKTKSMGMKITEERLKLIAKEGWEKLVHIIDLKDQLNQALGTRVEITIPLYNQV